MGKLMAKSFCIGFGCGRIGTTGSNKRSSSSSSSSSLSSSSSSSSCNNNNIKWEMRPGGMLVQKRSEDSNTEDLISLKVSTVSQLSYEISIDANSTFGELKMMITIVSGIEAKEQRLVFRGKEREDREYLHMIGVGDGDKVFLLQDPAFKEMKPTHLPITV
ncbi:PREDICTED: BAG family molecular chaperone regulator 2-like [Camelina sativa]|uniref:BAG family molecular chaperone regulator 2-like n=1 Tax=Camelina sativa TaxID=90675 RepID=A0ABM0U575_CAMSA|nr:PREDICTED: BAG family molecular chaperone regulator 2-like [Camelina sativa]